MIWALVILAAVALFTCAGLILLMRRLGEDTLPLSCEWLSELTTDRYRPMLRLLDERDFEFLRRQKGYHPEMEKRLREERARAFGAYLRMLDTDFRRLCDGLKQIMVEAEIDRPELASLLIQRQTAFACGMLLARFRLKLYTYGVTQPDATSLVELFEGIRGELDLVVSCVQSPA